MATEFVAVRQEMTTEFAAVRQEMTTEFAAVRQEMTTLRVETVQAIHASMLWMIGTMIALAGIVSGIVIAF
jgi:hypothetical protein